MTSACAPAISLELLRDPGARDAFDRAFGAPDAVTVAALAELVIAQARLQPQSAVPLAAALASWAQSRSTGAAAAIALRAQGNVEFLRSQYAEAVRFYEAALPALAADPLERGRTLSSMLHPLAMLGRSQDCLRAAEEARSCFREIGATHRLARLELNLASVWFREDRFTEALEALARAERGLEACEEGRLDHEAWGAMLLTRAVTQIGLAQFEPARAVFQQTREYAARHALPALAAQADYNIAYLYFLRGDHLRAFRELDAARATARRHNDFLHLALCDLDQADICIRLQLYEDARRLGQSASEGFERLGLDYERGKALTNIGVAGHFLGRSRAALDELAQAEKAFILAGNEYWVQLARLYRAAILLDLGRAYEAVPLCQSAQAVFQQRHALTKAVLAAMVEAEAWLGCGDNVAAERAAAAAAAQLGSLPAPWLQAQLLALQAQVEEGRGDPRVALVRLEAAMEQIEAGSGAFNFDELRLNSARDRDWVYQHSLELLVRCGAPPQQVWEHMERARAGAWRHALAVAPVAEGSSRVVSEIGRLREELNWYYRQLDPAVDDTGPVRTAPRVEGVLEAIAQREHELRRALNELPRAETRPPADAAASGQPAWPPACATSGKTVLAYFRCGRGYAVVAGRGHEWQVQLLPGRRSEVESALRLLHLHTSMPETGIAGLGDGAARQRTAASHLHTLHRLLLEPIAALLGGGRVRVIPHGELRGVPFSALSAPGAAPLLESCGLSLAPSAAALDRARQLPAGRGQGVALIATAAEAAPAELAVVRAQWPHAVCQFGSVATRAGLRSLASGCRVLYWHGRGATKPAANGGIALADGGVSAAEICRWRLKADLVVLTGAAPALAELTCEQDVLGWAEAFLLAGAKAVLTALWEMEDAVTAELLERLYRRWRGGARLEAALSSCQLDLRQQHPDPRHWAGWQLLGDGELLFPGEQNR